jgi:hypothetical protein
VGEQPLLEGKGALWWSSIVAREQRGEREGMPNGRRATLVKSAMSMPEPAPHFPGHMLGLAGLGLKTP